MAFYFPVDALINNTVRRKNDFQTLMADRPQGAARLLSSLRLCCGIWIFFLFLWPLLTSSWGEPGSRVTRSRKALPDGSLMEACARRRCSPANRMTCGRGALELLYPLSACQASRHQRGNEQETSIDFSISLFSALCHACCIIHVCQHIWLFRWFPANRDTVDLDLWLFGCFRVK